MKVGYSKVLNETIGSSNIPLKPMRVQFQGQRPETVPESALSGEKGKGPGFIRRLLLPVIQLAQSLYLSVKGFVMKIGGILGPMVANTIRKVTGQKKEEAPAPEDVLFFAQPLNRFTMKEVCSDKVLFDQNIKALSPQERDKVLLGVIRLKKDVPLPGSDLTLQQYVMQKYAESVEDKDALIEAMSDFSHGDYYFSLFKSKDWEVSSQSLKYEIFMNDESVLKSFVAKIVDKMKVLPPLSSSFKDLSWVLYKVASEDRIKLQDLLFSHWLDQSNPSKLRDSIASSIASNAIEVEPIDRYKCAKEKIFSKKVTMGDDHPPTGYRLQDLVDYLKEWDADLKKLPPTENMEMREFVKKEKHWVSRYAGYREDDLSFYHKSRKDKYMLEMIEDEASLIPRDLDKKEIRHLQAKFHRNMDSNKIFTMVTFDPDRKHEKEYKWVLNQLARFMQNEEQVHFNLDPVTVETELAISKSGKNSLPKDTTMTKRFREKVVQYDGKSVLFSIELDPFKNNPARFFSGISTNIENPDGLMKVHTGKHIDCRSHIFSFYFPYDRKTVRDQIWDTTDAYEGYPSLMDRVGKGYSFEPD
jgi:hypothetical protein